MSEDDSDSIPPRETSTAASGSGASSADPMAQLSVAQLLDALPYYVMLVDAEHHILAANRAVVADVGIEPEQLLGQYCPKVVHGTDKPYPGCPLEEAVATDAPSCVRELRDAHTGRWMRSSVYRVPAGAGTNGPIYLHFAQDVTEEHQRVADLRAARGQLRRNVEQQLLVASVLRVGLQDRGRDDLLLEVLELVLSAEWLPLLSRGSIHLVDPKSGRLSLRAQVGIADEICRACAELELGRCLCGRAAESGKVVYASHVDHQHEVRVPAMDDHGHYCVPILHGGRVLGVLNTYLPSGHERSEQEVTFLRAVADGIAGLLLRFEADGHRAQLQEHLRRAQKLDALGRLAGGVAHDFNNLLSVILSSASILAEELNPRDPLAEDAQLITAAARSAAQLTRQLLAFSRKQVVQPQALSLEVVLESLERMLVRLLGAGIELRVDAASSEGTVWMDPGQLEQVLVNLVVNAQQAMPKGGRVTIRAGWRDKHEGLSSAEFSPQTHARLVVADTGCGMSDDVQDRIFEPFFTTKAQQGGTGLGLSTVHGIVRQAGGDVAVRSVQGKGTTFVLYLPLADGQAYAPHFSKGPPADTKATRKRHVLVVEDDVVLRRSVARIFERAGYVVGQAGSAEQALALSGEELASFDLVLSDVDLPGVNGDELIGRLQAGCPALSVLLMTGQAGAAVSGLAGRFDVLPKPFTSAELLRHVAKLLG